MSLGSHSRLFARLGHGDSPVLHDLDAVRISVIFGLLVGILLIELESIGLEWVHFDFTGSHVSTIDH